MLINFLKSTSKVFKLFYFQQIFSLKSCVVELFQDIRKTLSSLNFSILSIKDYRQIQQHFSWLISLKVTYVRSPQTLIFAHRWLMDDAMFVAEVDMMKTESGAPFSHAKLSKFAWKFTYTRFILWCLSEWIISGGCKNSAELSEIFQLLMNKFSEWHFAGWGNSGELENFPDCIHAMLETYFLVIWFGNFPCILLQNYW